jgi:hypothetical protein
VTKVIECRLQPLRPYDKPKIFYLLIVPTSIPSHGSLLFLSDFIRGPLMNNVGTASLPRSLPPTPAESEALTP